MPIALTVLDIDNSGKTMYVTCALTMSGSYTTGQGGDTCDLTTIMGKAYLGRVFQAGKTALYGYVAGTTGDSYAFIPGTTLANGKVKCNTASATELGTGSYPARITGDANIYATFAFDLNL